MQYAKKEISCCIEGAGLYVSVFFLGGKAFCIHSAFNGGVLLGFGSANPCIEESYVTGIHTTYFGRAHLLGRLQFGYDIMVKKW